ncbi:putative iron-regulated membrane protein [Janthinobacterium sp. CG_23.3]|uniref:PepSY-associated TM helix domain-containing protein n=1 Tax=Janthinobacterium sp. CG_23.3 TaxID=3349634 RepID=UPI0038D49D5F
MRTEVIRLYKTVHTWTGIVSGLLLFIAFYAGAITMFEEPLARWASAPTRLSKPTLAQADALIAQTLAARPDARKEFTLHLGEAEHLPARLTWQKGRGDRAPLSANLGPDGALRVERLHPSGLAQFVDTLHRTGGVPGDPELGEHLMGVVSLLYAVALVSGVIILLPSLVKDFFALRLGRNLKRMWLDAHNVVGIASLPFHLVIALTAVTFGLHDQFYDVQDKLIYKDGLAPMMKAGSAYSAIAPDGGRAPMLPAAALLARVGAASPGFAVAALHYRAPGTAGAQVRVAGHDGRYMTRAEGFLVMSAVSGEIVNTAYFPGAQGTWSAPVSAFFSLHLGSFGGETVRWSYFLLGLAGAFLFYSGNLLWVETRRKAARKNAGPVVQQRSARLLAAGTVGVAVGCVAGISLAIAASKWLEGRVAAPDEWHRRIYYAVFVASVAWAFLRGAGNAAPTLLRLAAAGTAAIPLTSLLAWAIPALNLWAHGSAAALGVDVVAATGALALWSMARASARRAAAGPSDSVWAGAPMELPVGNETAISRPDPRFVA